MKNSKYNIRFNYLYRDAGNYKIFGSIIFNNLENIDIKSIEKVIKNKLIDGEFFNPLDWKIPRLHFDTASKALDHDWNEFEKIEITKEDATDSRTILEFIDYLNLQTRSE